MPPFGEATLDPSANIVELLSADDRPDLDLGISWVSHRHVRELPSLPLEDALRLVHLYAERGSPKYERAALRWLQRYLGEGSPRLQHFADVARNLAERNPDRLP